MPTAASSVPGISPRQPAARAGAIPRRRLELLCDAGSLQPLGTTGAGGGGHAGGDARSGVMCATGRVGGRLIACYAHDPAIDAGALAADHAEAVARLLALAGRAGVPVVSFIETAGARLQEGVAALAGCARLLRAHAALGARAPQIAVVCGKSAGAGSYAAALSDFLIMTEQAALFLTGPRVVRATIGEQLDARELGGPDLHSPTGLCHAVADDEGDAAALARELLSYLPQRAWAPLPVRRPRPPGPLRALSPDAARRGYDVRDVIAGVVDDARCLELSSRWAPNVLTGLARLEGRPIGLLASQPHHLGGLLDAAGARKAARFVSTCDTFGLPLIVLVDTPGFMPGRGQERAGVIHHGAALLRAFATARVPRITVILQKAYGGAYIALNARDLGADLTLAWPGAQIGIMSAEVAVGVAHGDRARERVALVNAYAERHISVRAAARDGFVDEVIEPRDTRARLCAALEQWTHQADAGTRD